MRKAVLNMAVMLLWGQWKKHDLRLRDRRKHSSKGTHMRTDHETVKRQGKNECPDRDWFEGNKRQRRWIYLQGEVKSAWWISLMAFLALSSDCNQPNINKAGVPLWGIPSLCWQREEEQRISRFAVKKTQFPLKNPAIYAALSVL